MIRITKGLDLPLRGTPDQVVGERKKPREVAVLGGDYVGMKPTMAVRVADEVKLGQVLFTDKKMPAVRYTAPGAGKVVAPATGSTLQNTSPTPSSPRLILPSAPPGVTRLPLSS